MLSKINRIGELRKEGFTWKGIFLRLFEYLGIKIPNKSIIENLFELIVLKKMQIFSKIMANFKKNNKSILVIETGVLGDSMLVANAFQKLQIFCNKNEYEFTLVCSYSMAKIFRDYGGCVDAKYVCYHDRNNIKLGEYKEIIKKLNNQKYEYLILRDSNPVGFRLASIITAKNRLYYSYDIKTRNKMERRSVNKYFNEIVEFDTDTFIPDIWKKILVRLGITDYITEIGRLYIDERKIEKYKKQLPQSEYVLLCPEASTRSRSIDIDMCRKIITYIKKKYDFTIVISTNKRDESYTENMKQLILETNTIDYLGNTNFDAFIMLVKKAKAMIGCDSGSVHLAAGLAIPCICLTGYWDSTHFFPYKLEKVKFDDKVPYCIYPTEKPKCAYCGERGQLCGEIKCKERVQDGMSVKCLADISIDDVILGIKQIIK